MIRISQVRVVDEGRHVQLDTARTLHEHLVGTVDHDFRHGLVLEETVDRSVAEDVVGDVLDQLRLVGGRQRCPLLGEC